MNVAPQINKLILDENDLKQIEILCVEHYNFVVTQERVLTYTSFESSVTGSGMSIDYNTFFAVDVTNFIKLNKAVNGQAALINEFKRYLESKTYLYYRLNKTIDYITITNSR